jgi:hypothetical protein
MLGTSGIPVVRLNAIQGKGRERTGRLTILYKYLLGYVAVLEMISDICVKAT